LFFREPLSNLYSTNYLFQYLWDDFMKVFNLLLLFVTLFFSSQVFANNCFTIDLRDNDAYSFKNNLKIYSKDGIKISANLFIPKSSSPKEGWPTIIFANSWLLDEHEYLAQAAKFAKDGFQVLSYSLRGWGCSEGELDILGPKDINDIKAVIDWIRDNTNVDMKNIAMSGISYGGGMSLMALAHDKRIKTVVAMSAWGSLTEALFKDETPRKFWTDFLVYTSRFFASPSDEMLEMVSNLFSHRNISETLEWTKVRNPINYISEINKRNAPVYIANNFGDNLFTPNNVWKYFDKLTVPKRLDLNQGAHATGEVFGLIGLDSYTWNRAFEWFNYYLKGKVLNPDITDPNTVTILTDLDHKREVYKSTQTLNVKNERFYFYPRKLYRDGNLSKSRYTGIDFQNTISNRFNSKATTGIPFLSAIVDGNFKVPVVTFIPTLLWHHGFTYNSSAFKETKKIRGIPSIEVFLTPSSKKYQLVAYLYHKDKFGYGRLITHGSVTNHDADVGKLTSVSFSLNATAYDIPKGDKLTVVIDTQDILYLEPTDSFYTLSFDYSKEMNSRIEVPILD
jgi:predicted acyl esterase